MSSAGSSTGPSAGSSTGSTAGRAQEAVRQLKPAPGIAHRRMPGSVVLSAALWGVLAILALWTGFDLVGSSPKETNGINSGDLAQSAQTHISSADVLSLVAGILLLVGVVLLLLGLSWSTYVLYLVGAVAIIDLAAGGHVTAAPAVACELVAGALLLRRSSRAYLGHDTHEHRVEETSIISWLDGNPPPTTVARRPSPRTSDASDVSGAARRPSPHSRLS